MRAKSKKQAIRVAVPYYGTLIRPYIGVEKVYFVADVDLMTSSVERLSVKVWNPKLKRELPRWIKNAGISGIICTDRTPCFLNYFDSNDIWIEWGRTGDVTSLVEQWALSQHPCISEPKLVEADNEKE